MPTLLALALATLGLLPANAAAGAALTGSATASSPSASAPTPHAAQPRARASRRKPKILHLPSPSQESPAHRDRRLTRECQGLPNAGACLGYALRQRRPQRR